MAQNEADPEPKKDATFGKNPETVPEPVRKLNPWTGLYHNDDGTKDFPDGKRVGGVNKYAQ